MTATEPRRFAAAAGAVTAPVGAVGVAVNVNTLVAVFPATSASGDRVGARRGCSAGPHEVARRVGAAGAASCTVSAACVQPGRRRRAGRAPMPRPSRHRSPWRPARSSRRCSIGSRSAAVLEGVRSHRPSTTTEATGAVLSTRTLVIVARGEGVARLVGGDDAQVVEPVRDARGDPVHGVRRRGVGSRHARPRAGACGERSKRALATPDPASAEFEVTADGSPDIGRGGRRGDRSGGRGVVDPDVGDRRRGDGCCRRCRS